MGRTFAEELDTACKKLYDKELRSETDRVHRETVRESKHAFQNVNITKPDPWKRPPLWQ